MKFLYISLAFLCLTGSISAKNKSEKVNADKESKVNLVRVDLLSIGVPNRIVGIGSEVLLPIPVPAIRNSFSIYGNFSPVTFVDFGASSLGLGDNAKTNLSTYEVGFNYYPFNRKGSGFYLSASYSAFRLKLENADVSKLIKGFSGEVSGKVQQSGLNARIGFKTGNKFYFRAEVGYTQFINNSFVELNGNTTTDNGDFTVSFNESRVKLKSILKNSGLDLLPISFNISLGISLFEDKAGEKQKKERRIKGMIRKAHKK